MNMWRFKEEHSLPSRFDTYTEDMQLQPETQKPEMQTAFDYPGTHKDIHVWFILGFKEINYQFLPGRFKCMH